MVCFSQRDMNLSTPTIWWEENFVHSKAGIECEVMGFLTFFNTQICLMRS